MKQKEPEMVNLNLVGVDPLLAEARLRQATRDDARRFADECRAASRTAVDPLVARHIRQERWRQGGPPGRVMVLARKRRGPSAPKGDDEAKRAKKARWLANRARRAEENRQRAQGNGTGKKRK